MPHDQYIQDAIRTESRIEAVTVDPKVLREMLQIAIAAANILDLAKKQIYYGKKLDYDALNKQLDQLHAAADYLDRGISVEPVALKFDPRVFHAFIGLFTESGELLEAAYKSIFKGSELDIPNVGEEVGDLNWYQAILLDALQLPLEPILERNIAKLKARYPKKFTSENAIQRDLETERKILEGKA